MAASAAVVGSLLLTVGCKFLEFHQTSGQISVAASLLALFVTWLFLLAITVIGTRQARRTGGGPVTLFTVARQEMRGES